MLAYHNDPALRDAVLAEIRQHMDADALIQGYGYWKNGKGCAVGCLLKSGNHIEYEERFGIPVQLAHLEDTIFENLSKTESDAWPLRFMSAAQSGADLSLVAAKFTLFLVEEALSRPQAEMVRDGCALALDVARRRANGETVSEEEESAARSAARSAAWSAARRAARAARSAARSAAESAESAESAAWSRYADKLVDLMEQAPVPETVR